MTPKELSSTYNSLVARMQAAERLMASTQETLQAVQANFQRSQQVTQDAAQILTTAIHNHAEVQSELLAATSSLTKLIIEHPELVQHHE